MKTTPYAGLAIKVALFYFIVAGVCHSIQAQAEIHFRLAHDTLIVVSVMADQEGPFEFVLDTGADTTIVDPSIAYKLPLVPQDRVEQRTLAGIGTVSRTSLLIMSVGPAQAENIPVLLQDLTHLRQLDPNIEGIVGQNFLSQFNYLIDYHERTLHFEQDAEIQDSVEGDRVPLQVGNNRMLIACEAWSRNHAKLHLLLDSGANSVVFLHAAAEAVNPPAQASGVETTSGGQIRLRVARVHELRVGSEQFHDIAAALPASDPSERIGDGLLPTAFFRGLYVNNQDHFVVLNPRARKN